MPSFKAVNIDPLDPVAGRISIGGAEHDVLHLTGRDYRRIAGNFTALDAFDVASRLVPSLTLDAIDGLTAAQVGNIIAIADGRIADVEAQFPNGTGPGPASELTGAAVPA